MYVNYFQEETSETAHILQYANDCILPSKKTKSEIDLAVLQDNMYKLENNFRLNKCSLN